MELWALQVIADGTVSLAELERTHPIIGQKFKRFVVTINRCCRDAYERFSSALDDVLTLPLNATEEQRSLVLQSLRDASDSKWFRDIANICDDLAAVAKTYDTDIKQHASAQYGISPDKQHSLLMMLMVLHKHEGDLKQDIRHAVDGLKLDIADARVSDARDRAVEIKREIAQQLTRINGVSASISGSSTDGADEILSREEVAEEALRRPERVLLLNMAFFIVLLITGSTVMQYVSLLAFPLLTAFVLASVVILNAFYLRSIDKLREESFLELVRLALLKFFAPFGRRTHSTAQSADLR